MSKYTRITMLSLAVSLGGMYTTTHDAVAEQAGGTGGSQCVICVQTCSGVDPSTMCSSIGGCGDVGSCFQGTATGCGFDFDDQDERVFCSV